MIMDQMYYRKSLGYIETAIHARACSPTMLEWYELQRQLVLKLLLRVQIREFDRG